MQTIQQTFAGAQTWILNIPGKYFTIIGCTNPVNVQFFKGGSKLSLGTITGLSAGLEVLLGDPSHTDPQDFEFDRVEIGITGADTVTIGIGNGQARYNRSQGNVAITNTAGAFANVNATVTNASAQLVAAKANRRYLLIQNNDATGDIYVRFDGAAATLATGVKIKAGGAYEAQGYVPTGAITAIGSIASNVNIVTVEG